MLRVLYPLLIVSVFVPQYTTANAREVTSMKEFREVLSQKKPLCIMFYAPWCSACKVMKEPFNQAAQALKKDVLLVKIDADNEKFKEAADSFGVEAIPTIVFKHVGVLSKDQLVKAINGFVNPTRTAKEAPKKVITKKPTPKKPQGSPKKQAPAATKKANPQKSARKA